MFIRKAKLEKFIEEQTKGLRRQILQLEGYLKVHENKISLIEDLLSIKTTYKADKILATLTLPGIEIIANAHATMGRKIEVLKPKRKK